MKLAVWKYFSKIWYLTFSSVQHLMTFQLSRFDHTGAAIDTSWVQFNVSSLMTIYACAGLKLEWKPSHIFHIQNVFVNDLYLLNTMFQCMAKRSQEQGLSSKTHPKSLSASFGADIYTHGLFSPFVLLSAVKSSWVFKAVVLVKCLTQHLQCLHW